MFATMFLNKDSRKKDKDLSKDLGSIVSGMQINLCLKISSGLNYPNHKK